MSSFGVWLRSHTSVSTYSSCHIGTLNSKKNYYFAAIYFTRLNQYCWPGNLTFSPYCVNLYYIIILFIYLFY